MRLGKVVGTVVATQKSASLVGGKLLVVQDVDALTMQLKDSYTVAYDTVGVGAAEGEIVLTVGGSSARLTDTTADKPIDTAIIAIIDHVEVHGKQVFP
ncbi:MAG: EutN/CcmL family microcompartment protein [Fimbriimonadaceae bacterium]|nr:EutN/CcmL family microcompartment protein [Fimbriimonadaceae bacterium]